MMEIPVAPMEMINAGQIPIRTKDIYDDIKLEIGGGPIKRMGP